MSKEVHGHEVMQMMAESGKTFTRQTLKQAIEERFGKETVFYTCSAQGLSVDELIDFLEQRGKFLVSDDGFSLDQDMLCGD